MGHGHRPVRDLGAILFQDQKNAYLLWSLEQQVDNDGFAGGPHGCIDSIAHNDNDLPGDKNTKELEGHCLINLVRASPGEHIVRILQLLRHEVVATHATKVSQVSVELGSQTRLD